MISPEHRLTVRVAALLAFVVLAMLWLRHRGETLLREHAPASAQSVPADMVGVWTSTRGGVMRCIELASSGRWTMLPNTEAGDRFTTQTGTWRVVGQEIVWQSDTSGETDRNEMLDVRDGHFLTVEADRSRARFDRLVPGGLARCPRDRG